MPESHDESITIPSDTSHAAEVQERIVAALENHDYSARDIFAMRLAIEEALVNAIKHGNKRDLNKQVAVSWSVSSEQVIVVVEDEGPGFNPENVPDCTAEENLDKACGRGITLMKNFLTAVEYNARGNRVTLVKQRDAESDATARA
jgi:serine/threonine-protein kinase RsbW